VPGTGRADVWVFDANNLGTSLGGNPLTVVRLFGDRPRALAVSPDGSKVYAAVYRSGNRTTSVNEKLVCDGAGPCTVSGTTYPAGRPLPEINFQGGLNRETGIIVGFNPANGRWEDERGTNWSPAVRFSLPDLDVFEINANAATPAQTRAFAGVGTILFNMIVNPVNGKLYVTNTNANNRTRFEGVGNWVGVIGPKPSGDPPSVLGNLHKARVTVIDAAGNVTPRHLNKHIPYGVFPVPAGVKEKSVGTPLGMAVSSDGTTLYVAGFGSNAVAVFDTAELENGTFVPSAANMIPIEGPTGLVLDEARGFLWISSNRALNDIYSYNLSTGLLRPAGGWRSPEPAEISQGRKFLYDTQLTSSNGESSCSSCHPFGDMDDLAWDLGDPDAIFVNNPNPCAVADLGLPAIVLATVCNLQPLDALKGPMTTQSLRGLANSGPMHWRGDRSGGTSGGDPLDEAAAFNAFNVAFPGLVGRDEGELDPEDMQAFTNFALALTYPPNPIRALDNSLNAQQTNGFNLFHQPGIDANVLSCNNCHRLDRDQGQFGTNGGSTFETEAAEFKVAHLRNLYQKVGMFGTPPSPFIPNADGTPQGDQIRGFGFLHDGSIDRAFNFLGADVFNINDAQQRDLEAFVMAFDSNLAPIVGQQATVSSITGSDTLARVNLLIQRADTTYYTSPTLGAVKECDLIAKGVIAGQQRGWRYLGSNNFQSDLANDPTWSKSQLLTAATQPGQAITFTCVPPGSGVRMGIDRDEDTVLDANDTMTCSAGPIGASHRGNLAAMALLMIAGLAVRRRSRRS